MRIPFDAINHSLGPSNVAVPKKVFKFLFKEHKNSMLSGCIKIGRLGEYRETEQSNIKDNKDGVATAYINYADFNNLHRESLVRQAISKNPNSIGRLNISNSIFHVNYDTYIFCFSIENNESVVDSFMIDKPYDSLIEIKNIEILAYNISRRHPVLRNWHYIIHPIIYTTDSYLGFETERLPIVQIFQKNIMFSNNKEGRIVFIPPDHVQQVGRHFNVTVPRTVRRLERTEQIWSHPYLGGLFIEGAMPV